MRTLLPALTFALVTVTVVPCAEAQDAQTEEARQEFEAGVAASREGRWVEARGHFERAAELAPRPTVLANLGSAQQQTGQLVEARDSYRRFLAVSTDPKPPERIRAESRRSSRGSGASRSWLDGDRPGDVVLLDGRPVDPGHARGQPWCARACRARRTCRRAGRPSRSPRGPRRGHHRDHLTPALPDEPEGEGGDDTPVIVGVAAAVAVAVGVGLTLGLYFGLQPPDPTVGTIRPGQVRFR
ncbi:MAG: tetratricopeptide repeat protein [Sandaracinaceae bacterium]